MAEKEIKEENLFVLWILPQIIYIVLSAAVSYIVFWVNDKSVSFLIQSLVITIIFNSLHGLALRRFFPVSISVYADNNKRLRYYWLAYGTFFLIATACVFMPDASWPFSGIFAVLTVYGGPFIGSIGGASLLIMSALLAGDNIGVLVIYLFCGVLCAVLFSDFQKKLKFVQPSVISLVALFAMVSFGMAVGAPDSLSVLSFILPLINVLLSGIIIYVGIRSYYVSMIVVTTDKYLILNDTGYPILAEVKDKDYNNYMLAIHTSYFCERIALKLDLDVQAMKCAGYYYRFCPTGEENRENFLLENDFPQKAAMILTEYTDFISKRSKGKVFSKECAVLICAQTVVVTCLAMYSKNPNIKIGDHIDKIVDATFERYDNADTFKYSEITFTELQTVKELFKGEKLYYDFLCRK